MYQITDTKKINPAHIVSMEYKKDEVVGANGEAQAHLAIQMVNHTGNIAFLIEGSELRCQEIESELTELVNKCNNNVSYFEEATIVHPPGGDSLH